MTSSLELNPEIFRAYDIRGIVGKDIDESIAITMGKAIGTYLLKNFEGKNVVVGMDNRLHSEGLKKALVEGLLSVGCNVTDIGMSTGLRSLPAIIQKNITASKLSVQKPIPLPAQRSTRSRKLLFRKHLKADQAFIKQKISKNDI